MSRHVRSFSVRACLLGLGALALATPSSAQSPAEIQQAVDARVRKVQDAQGGQERRLHSGARQGRSEPVRDRPVTADGKVYTAGDVKTEVSIQSISKVFTMAQVIQEQGPDAIETTHRRRCHGRTVQLDHRG